MESASEKEPKKIIPIILGVILIIGAVFGIREYIYFSKHTDTDDAQLDGDISPVSSRVSGYVDSVFFEENEHVQAGQVLVKLDDRDLKIKLEQALAAQRGAYASIDVSQSRTGAAAAAASTAKANAETARIKLEQAEKDYKRYVNLVKDGAVTRQQFEQVKASRDAAEAAYRAAQQQYRSALQQEAASRSQTSVTSTTVDQQQAAVDFAKLQLSYTVIKAPVSGFVSKKNIQIGQLVQAGQSLFSIVNDSSLYVTANFKETQLENLRKGQHAEIEVDAFPDEPLEGEVYNFSPATGAKFSLLPPDNATGNFVKVVQRVPVKIKIKAPPEMKKRLRPGMSVTVSVRTKE